MQTTLIGIAVSFLALLAVFRLLDLTRPVDRRLPMLRRGFWTDAAYWAFTPLITRAVTRVSIAIAAIPIALLLYGHVDRQTILEGFGPLAGLPLPLQAFLILFVSDFFGYWGHRLFHRGRLWRFHAIHHCSKDLDWLSSTRLHPANDAVMRVLSTVPVLLIGVKPLAVAGVLPFITLMAIVVHANVDWDWGPLRSVLASPRFHRWHHSDEADARDKNFAGIFPVFDLVFGTYYMPRGRVPTSFGTDLAVPEGFLAQLWFPFRRQD